MPCVHAVFVTQASQEWLYAAGLGFGDQDSLGTLGGDEGTPAAQAPRVASSGDDRPQPGVLESGSILLEIYTK